MFHSFLPLTYVVRTAADPASLIARIRASFVPARRAGRVDPNVALRDG